ncbi:hypothetical protein [Pedobacter xixiisoli]|uniref:Uncharacterized protein n=1 Tax=Pedobacter xixiisoli TaxID=1476464 RepID=A0A285ZUH0_9SPHI|nr:hypothetical protein [Pedobacter xixiisoli]SOD13272.1 hypothetical protein SAMN06297358_1099 [Pedobacter xixiisoli]
MEKQTDNYQLILNKLDNKASLKQEIYRNTVDVFAAAKKALSKLASRLHQDYTVNNPSVEVSYKDTHQFEAELKFSGDMLLLSMHSNIFNFEEGHRIYSSTYIKSNPNLSYCGVIYIHNFLADSVKYNRLADEGTLVARILINKEKRFIVEGEGQLGFLYESFSEEEISEEVLTHIFELAILDCIDTDLLLPPYASVKDITLHQKQTTLAASGYPTGKRLGYLFKSEVQQNNNL